LRRTKICGIMAALAVTALVSCGASRREAPADAAAAEFRLMTLAPGHFHAALLQEKMLPGVSSLAYVYAPLGSDLTAHLDRIARFNSRRWDPTAWRLEVYAGPDYFERMLAERPGNVVVLSGRNRGKIGRIQASIGAGLNVLADKPWIIEASDMPQLEAALDSAGRKGLIAYDAMTQHFEVTCRLQRDLVNDPQVFGDRVLGSEAEPAVRSESLHYLFKNVAGVPNHRPVWFFDIREQGEGLTDVGTHLVDLVQWTLFPAEAIDYRRDIKILSAERWPTMLTEEQFRRVTGAAGFPKSLAAAVKNGRLEYYCNNRVHYTIRGVHTVVEIKWGFAARPGTRGVSIASYQGSRSRVEVRQGKRENYHPEVYVVPGKAGDKAELRAALERELERLQGEYPGIDLQDSGGEFHIRTPAGLRVGHEAHFALLTARFFDYLRDPGSLPPWEKANMLAKYYVTTRGVELARNGADGTSEQR